MSKRPMSEKVLDTRHGEAGETVEEVCDGQVDDKDGGGGPCAVKAEIFLLGCPGNG